MPEYKLEELVQTSQTLGLLSLDDVQEIWRSLRSDKATVDSFFNMAVQRGFLTRYQSDRLIAGDTSGFFYGDYKVLSLLGLGAVGRVFRAFNKETGKIVALKVLRSRFIKDRQVLDYFDQESKLTASLQHKNIPAYRETFKTKTDLCQIYDIVEGRSLAKILKMGKPMAPREAVRVMKDVCSALDFAFKRGHIHRDLKMSNVIVSNSGSGMLVGFGRELVTPDLEVKLRSPSSIDYAALEKLTNVSFNDKRSDIYFLGALLYYVLSGRPALFETDDMNKRGVRHRFFHIRRIQEVNPNVPELLVPILNRAICFEPEKRYQTPGALLKDLENAYDALVSGQGSAPATKAQTEAPETGKTVFILDSNIDMQEFYKEKFKKKGYKIILVSDVARAIERYEFGDSPAADCILINAQQLGQCAVDAFNRFAIVRNSRMIPAVLMLGEHQKELAQKDTIHCGTRGFIQMPFTVGNLFEVIEKLIATEVNQDKINRLVSEFLKRQASQKNGPVKPEEDETHSFPIPPLPTKSNKAADDAFAEALENLTMFTD